MSRRPVFELALRAVALVALIPLAGGNAVGTEGYRSYDGNNTIDPYRGASGRPLIRLTPHDYSDYMAEPAGAYRPSAREVSNAINAETHVVLNPQGASDYVWLWGQFLDHDIDLTPGAAPAEPFDIEVPAGDPWFDPAGTGAATIGFARSIYDPKTGWQRHNPRRQLNMITSTAPTSTAPTMRAPPRCARTTVVASCSPATVTCCPTTAAAWTTRVGRHPICTWRATSGPTSRSL